MQENTIIKKLYQDLKPLVGKGKKRPSSLIVKLRLIKHNYKTQKSKQLLHSYICKNLSGTNKLVFNRIITKYINNLIKH